MVNIKQAEAGDIPTRQCIDCNMVSPNLLLFVTSNESKHGRRNLCWTCAVKRNEKNPRMRDWKTNHQTLKRYGVNADVYKERMMSSNCCEICNSTEELCYDHDHDTMDFRGVLCRGCNRSLGQLGDNLEGIERVVKYLKKNLTNEK